MNEITPAEEHHYDGPGALPVADVPHKARLTDTDPQAARRAERQVTFMFILAILLFIAFIVAYIAVDKNTVVYIPVFGEVGASTMLLGLTLGLGAFLIGAAAIQWAKKLMPDVEVVQERHEMASPESADHEALDAYTRGKTESGFAQYKMIRRTLIGAMALFPIPLVVILRDLWVTPPGSPGPATILSHTLWRKGSRIVVDGTYQPLKASDLPVGGMISAVPADLPAVEDATGNLDARGKAAIVVVRMAPNEIVSQQGTNWDYQGILAFSKICTHAGCPISLYEQRTHHLLCPCHQSTFDLADGGAVVFGPAARPMPQLPIGVDAEGYLVAQADFAVPIGPSFWERG